MDSERLANAHRAEAVPSSLRAGAAAAVSGLTDFNMISLLWQPAK